MRITILIIVSLTTTFNSKISAHAEEINTHQQHSLTLYQRENLAELIAISHHDEDQDVFECVLELVRMVDVRFTRTAPRELRENICQVVVNDPRVDDVLKSLRRQLDTSEIFEKTSACENVSERDFREMMRRAITVFGRVCLKGRSLSLVGERWSLYSVLFSVTIAIVLGMALILFRTDKLFSDSSKKRREKKKCNCAMCMKQIVVTERIGEGAFGTVHRCRDVEKNESCVVKMIKVNIEFDVNELQEALDEAKHLISLRHEHIVSYNDVFVHRRLARVSNRRGSWDRNLLDDEEDEDLMKKESMDFVCIAMEYCSEGTLLDGVEDHMLQFSGLVDFVRQIGRALAYLHKRGVVHCDVKLENVFITVDPAFTSRLILKLGDFGLATKLKHSMVTEEILRAAAGEETSSPSNNGNETTGHRREKRSRRRHIRASRPGFAYYVAGGTIMYQSPETFKGADALKFSLANGKLGISEAVDVWAFGCSIWEAATGLEVPQDPPYLGEIALEGGSNWQKRMNWMRKKFRRGLDRMIHKEIERERRKLQIEQKNRSPLKRPRGDSNPFGALYEDEDASSSCDIETRLEKRKNIFIKARDTLIEFQPKMLHENPRKRPRLKDVLQYCYLDETQFFFRLVKPERKRRMGPKSSDDDDNRNEEDYDTEDFDDDDENDDSVSSSKKADESKHE